MQCLLSAAAGNTCGTSTKHSNAALKVRGPHSTVHCLLLSVWSDRFAVLGLVEGISRAGRRVLLVDGLVGISVPRYGGETCRKQAEKSSHTQPLPRKCIIHNHFWNAATNQGRCNMHIKSVCRNKKLLERVYTSPHTHTGRASRPSLDKYRLHGWKQCQRKVKTTLPLMDTVPEKTPN